MEQSPWQYRLPNHQNEEYGLPTWTGKRSIHIQGRETGATQPLEIINLEDKIVQKMMQKVLESIYEPLFLECSHGFRSEKSCHTAIQALQLVFLKKIDKKMLAFRN
jgi:retron-type reverse transcriptase